MATQPAVAGSSTAAPSLHAPAHNSQPARPLSASPVHRTTFHEPSIDDKEANPARFLGYRVFSRWIASDPTYFIVRKFGALNARTILALQDEIVELEQTLTEYDEEWSRSKLTVSYPNPDSLHNGTFRADHDPDRVTFIRETIAEKLHKYSRYVNEYSRLAQQAQPNPRDVDSVRLWLFANHRYAIEPDESDYINYDEDLIAVQPKIRPWFRSVLERTRFLKIKWFVCFRRQPKDVAIIYDKAGFWPNDGKIDGFSALVIALIGLGMLVGPLWWLNFVEEQAKRLGIITGFSATFFVLVHVGTRAKVSEALASAAAYSAVLVVFLQLQAPENPPGT